MNIKIIYTICGICILGTGLVFFLIFKNKSSPSPPPPIIHTSRPPMPPMPTTSRPPTPPMPTTSRRPMPPMPTTSRRPIPPEPVPKNPLEDAYYMSKKMNKDTQNIKEKLCKTLDAKTLFPDICN
jgi:type IV secretory pathway VirB10-like protein